MKNASKICEMLRRKPVGGISGHNVAYEMRSLPSCQPFTSFVVIGVLGTENRVIILRIKQEELLNGAIAKASQEVEYCRFLPGRHSRTV